MSMSSSFVYGYGFTCDWEIKDFIEFVKAHRETFCRTSKEENMFNELMTFIGDENEDDLDELFGEYTPDRYGWGGIGAVIDIAVDYIFGKDCNMKKKVVR